MLRFRIETFDMKLFKRMIAFVMAYSFSEDQESPSMIPMADMLNHHSNNNALLMFERNSLKMMSCRKIDKVWWYLLVVLLFYCHFCPTNLIFYLNDLFWQLILIIRLFKSSSSFSQGEEIFNTFGKLGNAELLQMYGYTEDNNNFDTVTILFMYSSNLINDNIKF